MANATLAQRVKRDSDVPGKAFAAGTAADRAEPFIGSMDFHRAPRERDGSEHIGIGPSTLGHAGDHADMANQEHDGVLTGLILSLLSKEGSLGAIRTSIGRLLPSGSRDRLLAWLHGLAMDPPRGRVRFGHLKRLTPISRSFGFARGLPVDRYYMERFLSSYAADIRGRVLEIGDDRYVRKFGGGRVARTDILHVEQGHTEATIVADLSRADHLAGAEYDCIIFVATLDFIYDAHAAVRTLHRLLKPGGILLTTLGGIRQVSRHDMNRWGDYWRFTDLSARRMFEAVFSPAQVTVEVFGNVRSAIAFLHGLAAEDLSTEDLDVRDLDYQVLICVRAERDGLGT